MARLPVPFSSAAGTRGRRAERFSRDQCATCQNAPDDPNQPLARRAVAFPGSEEALDGRRTSLDDADDENEVDAVRAGRAAWPRGR